MAAGHVYILVNASMPELVKVGKTTQTPNIRADTLSSATGVPTIFQVFKSYSVSDCDAAEKFAHTALEGSVGRPNKNREFFNGPAQTICSILDDALAPWLSQSSRLTDAFEPALKHVARKEFTMACLEFEQAFSQLADTSNMAFQLNSDLTRMLGAYLASCVASKRMPSFVHCITDSRLKTPVMQHAIELLGGWSNDPSGAVINFVRQLS